MASFEFLQQFLMDPRSIGAIAKSSEELASVMVESAHLPFASSVVELGTGTGAFTEKIVERISPGCNFIALELNPYFARVTRGRFPQIQVYNESALNIRNILSLHRLENCECIISGLPWASFSSEEQERMIAEIEKALAPDGEFRTFSYLQSIMLPSGIHFRKLLERHFSQVEKSKIVWNNIPPAFVYVCRK